MHDRDFGIFEAGPLRAATQALAAIVLGGGEAFEGSALCLDKKKMCEIMRRIAPFILIYASHS